MKTIVNLHGGTVTTASSGPGSGSTFTICLPAALDNATSQDAVTAAGAAPGLEPIHIMIVDDNNDGAETLAALLEAQGHTVDVFAHPLRAIEACETLTPQMFILDIGLPEIDGYELVRRLRKHPALSRSIYVALTGYGQAHDRTLSKAAGFDQHFVKPMDTQNLMDLFRMMRTV